MQTPAIQQILSKLVGHVLLCDELVRVFDCIFIVHVPCESYNQCDWLTCSGVVGYRACGASGDWLSDKTNYSQCFQFPAALPAHLDNNQSMSHLRMQSQQPIPNLGTWTEVQMKK